MDMSWIALLFFTSFWFDAVPVYESRRDFAPTLIISGMVFMCASFWRGFKRKGALSIRGKLSSCLKDGMTQSGFVIAAQAAAFPFLYWVFARIHAESFFTSLSGNLLNLLGLRTTVEGGNIYILNALKTVVVSGTLEKVGAFHFLLLLTGGAVLLALKKADFRRVLGFVGFTLLYMVLRYTFLLAVYAHYERHGIFWQHSVAFLLLLPYALILSFWFRDRAGFSPFAFLRSGFTLKKSLRVPFFISIGIVFFLAFCGTAFFGWRALGNEKSGRVVVDEYHSDWAWTDEAYDEQWFGERSGYNYYCFYEHIARYYDASRNTEPISAETLANADVLILKTPTSPYSGAETAAILDFVRGGGGLYLIGDHTNVFGTSAYLNQLAVPVGLRFRYDCTYDLATGNLQEYDAPNFLPHPVIQGLPHFLFATSCTLEAGWLADEVMLGYGLRNLPLDYSQKNFFPASPDAPSMEFGVFVQSAGVAYGKGRVLAFADSTVFSNFWMFMPGKPELLLKSLQWLNREITIAFPPRLAAALGLAAALIALLWLVSQYRRRGYVFPIGPCLCAALVSFGLSAVVFQSQSDAIRMPELRKPAIRVCFESEATTGRLPRDLEGFLSNMGDLYSTFYVWTQRLGCVPSLEGSPLEALEKGDVAVILKPNGPIREQDALLDLIRGGKTLLLLDNSGVNAEKLLESGGLRISQSDAASTAAADALFGEPTVIPLTSSAAAVEGGLPLVTDENGRAIFSVQTIGKGKLAVFTDPDLFYNINLGDVSANLTDQTRTLTHLEFQIFKYLLGL